MTTEQYWDNLLDYGIACEEALTLATYLCGYSTKTLDNVLFALTGYRDWEQYANAE